MQTQQQQKLTTKKITTILYHGQDFGWDGVDHRMKEGHINMRSKIFHIPQAGFILPISMFLLFFPEGPQSQIGTEIEEQG